MSAAHSILAPSSAARRWQCTASTRLEAAYPETDEDRTEAAEGEAAHWAASEMIGGRMRDVGERAPNGLFLTQEMVEGADMWFDVLANALAPYKLKPSDGRAEQQIRIPRVHAESFGTPDFSLLVPGHLVVADYKFGHRFVQAFENAQLVEYAAGLIPTEGLDEMRTDVTFIIVQPRAYDASGPVRTWRTTAVALRALINVASNSAHEALGPDAKQRVGPECRDCRARHACVSLQRAAYAELDQATASLPVELPSAALGVELGMLSRGVERLRARLSGLEQQALARIKAGQSIPGWTVEHGSGRQRWTRPAAEVLHMGQMLGLDLAKPVEPVTPKQAVAKGLPEVTLAALAETPRAEAKLVRDTGAKARATFGAPK